MARLIRVLATCATAACVLAGCASSSTARVTLGTSEVAAYVADSDEERSTGLQGYEQLAEGEGMLFVFDDEAVRTFAMKEVSFPIDVVFVGTDLTVSAIEPLDPGETRLVSSPGPSPYVIELPQGWARSQGVVVGSEVRVAE